jgi:hypothetical protein
MPGIIPPVPNPLSAPPFPPLLFIVFILSKAFLTTPAFEFLILARPQNNPVRNPGLHPKAIRRTPPAGPTKPSPNKRIHEESSTYLRNGMANHEGRVVQGPLHRQ